MTFTCITKQKAEEFKKKLKGREIELGKLISMETEARTELLSQFFGADAQKVNTLFEEKLILKNRVQGLKNWLSKITESGRYSPKQKKRLTQLVSDYRAKQQERIFNPQEDEAFLADLAEEKLGTRITREEAKNIFDMTQKVEELKQNFNPETEKWTSEKDRLEYGATKVALENYINTLKGENTPIKEIVRNRLSEFKKIYGENKAKAVFDLFKDSAKQISDNSIAMVASLDNSFLGRQGLRTLMTHPSAWWNGAKNSFIDFAKTLRGQETMDALMADIYSKPNYINGQYEQAKIFPKTEEQFPTTLPERLLGIGRVFKASEVAFKGSAVRMRSDLYDLVSNIAKNNEVILDKTQIQDIGKMVNSLTARGQWGKRGEPAAVRLVLWAPKMLKANIDVLTAHGLGAGLERGFTRKQAALNLLKIISSIATILMISRAIKKDSVEFDSRSSDFGKLKFGDTRFDITGGMASLAVLASRLVTNSYKSSTTGLVKKYGAEYGGKSRFDILVDFLTNKTTPAAGIIVDMLKGEARMGEPLTAKGEIYRGFTPISIQNFIELKDNYSSDRVAGAIADIVGLSSLSYSATTNWEQSSSKEIMEFKSKIGTEKFKKANDKFNKMFNDWLKEMYSNSKFQSLSDENKQKVITKKKNEIKDRVFREYNFVPKKAKPTKLPKF